MPAPLFRKRAWLLASLLACTLASPATAQTPDTGPRDLPALQPPANLSELVGRSVVEIDVEAMSSRWTEVPVLRSVRVGDRFSSELARRALRELAQSGQFADVQAEAEAVPGGVRLRLLVVPQKLVVAIRLTGSPLDDSDVLRAAGIRLDREITEADLSEMQRAIERLHRERGYPKAQARVEVSDTDDPRRVLVRVNVVAGAAAAVARRRFSVAPSAEAPGLRPLLARYAIEVGARADEARLDEADAALARQLKTAGWHGAEVSHGIEGSTLSPELVVRVNAGPKVRLHFLGLQHFDASQLTQALNLDEREDFAPAVLVNELSDFYAARGFYDAEIRADLRGQPTDVINDLWISVRERSRLRITRRHYACLSGQRSADDLDDEIDAVLAEELPASGFLTAPDPQAVDRSFGSPERRSSAVTPLPLEPWSVYVPEAYDRALEHVQELYRSEGYLHARVGPVTLLRRHCEPRSPPGACRPLGPRRVPPAACSYDARGAPLEEPPLPRSLTCRPNPALGVRCEPEVVVHIPVKLGPRTTLYDVAFEGNQAVAESELLEEADLELGEPLSQVELEDARRRLLDRYAEDGFAFADVETDLEFSEDLTRARVRFLIGEREPVRVSRIVIRGAQRTRESIVLSRIALSVGGLYRRSLVRRTEELLATLGVFSSISVGLEDPYVPAREKVVVVSVVERQPQYVDVRPGFSTGDGFRIGFEYGHRNLGGYAIQLTLRSQLGILPLDLIFEDDVRRKFEELSLGERLERRNTATVQFPDIGLGPLFRLSVEGLDLRDNSRDFGLTKDAAIVTLIYRPRRVFSVHVGGSLELNDATIFGQDQKGALEQFVRDNPRFRSTFRVPEGTTVAIAERLGFAWDRRDQPLDATRGTLVSAEVEHVQADPVGDSADGTPTGDSVFEPTTSDFLRYTNRWAGYIRLSDAGMALAVSYRWGFIQQLTDTSRTYPDRLFFMGGVDTIRGFLQDAMVPEDVAQSLLDETSGLTLNEIVIRGGDIFVNPRAELRIPLGGVFRTALFLDAGNLWTNPDEFDHLKLRYAVGTGLRIGTPVGPLAFDYGFNVDRVLDAWFPSRQNRRSWEDLGAFHFSIGVF